MTKSSRSSSKVLSFLALTLALICSSCSKDDDYDRKKAISAFVAIDHSLPDASLAKITIKLPLQRDNDLWNGSSSEQNQRVENISKTFFAKKNSQNLVLRKNSKIWSQFKFGYDDRLIFAPVIIGSKVFLLKNSGVLAAYDIKSEEKIWQKRIFPRRLLEKYRTPKIYAADGKIFAIAGVNKIVATDQEDGHLIWSKDISAIPVSAPISDGNLLYVITDNNKLYAFGIDSGKVMWIHAGIARPTAILGSSDPVIYKDVVIATYSSGEIYAINRKSGETIWSKDLNLTKAINSDFYLTDIDATPVVKDDTIYSIGNGGLMMALRISDGSYLWKKEISGISDFWLAGDWIFVINNGDKLLAIQRSSGLVKWATQLPDLADKKKMHSKIIYNGVVLAGNKLVISSSRGDVIIASPLSGNVEKTYSIGKKTFHAPVVVNGKIYLHALSRFFVDLIELE